MARVADATRTADTSRTAQVDRFADGTTSSGGTPPPVISGVVVSDITPTSVRLTWNTTGVLTTTQVHYGTTAGLGSSTTLANTPASSAGVVAHSVTITGLTANTAYYYRPESSDGSNTVTTSVTTFTTAVQSGGGGGLDDMTLSAIELEPTFNSIGVGLQFTGDDGANSTAVLAFKPTADPDQDWVSGQGGWRYHVDDAKQGRMHRTQTSAGADRAFYGSCLELTHNTSYDIRVVITDPSHGTATVTGTVSTRNDAIASHATLLAAATHWVDAVNGSDAANGTSAVTPWKTLSKLFTSGTASTVVAILEPGVYTTPNALRSTKIIMVARNPAVTYSAGAWTPEPDRSKWSIVRPAGQSAPTGTGADASYSVAPWTQELAADGVAGHDVWKWTASPVIEAGNFGYSSTRTGAQSRVGSWTNILTGITTLAGWVSMLYTNQTYNYGVWTAVGGSDVYVRLPGDLDPNTLWTNFSRCRSASNGQRGFWLNGDDSRVCGVVMQNFHYAVAMGRTDAQPASRHIADRCLFENNYAGVALNGRNTTVDQYGYDHVVQHNIFQDSNLTDPTFSDSISTIAWDFIKDAITLANGTQSSLQDIGRENETNAVYSKGGARRVVCRYNKVVGTFNGFSNEDSTGYDKHNGRDWDIHDNYFELTADDCIGMDFGTINVRVWGNTFKDTFVVVSIAPGDRGPGYFFKNQVWRMRADHLRRDPGDQGAGYLLVYAFKYSGSSAVVCPKWYVVNNTFWSNFSRSDGMYRGDGGGGAASTTSKFWLRNNIFRMGEDACHWINLTPIDENANHFATSNATTTKGLITTRNDADVDVGPDFIYRSLADVATYKARYLALKGVANSLTNVAGAVDDEAVVDGALTDVTTGDLTLTASSVFKLAGTPVGNITDTLGRAANLGYVP